SAIIDRRQFLLGAERHSASLPPRLRALVAFHRAFEDGQLSRARRIVEGLIARDPTDVEAWYQLGEAHYHDRSDAFPHPDTLGNLGRALRAFQHTLALDSSYVLAYQHILDALARCAGADGSAAFHLCVGDSAAYGTPDELSRRFGARTVARWRDEARAAQVQSARAWVAAVPGSWRPRQMLLDVLYSQRRYESSGRTTRPTWAASAWPRRTSPGWPKGTSLPRSATPPPGRARAASRTSCVPRSIATRGPIMYAGGVSAKDWERSRSPCSSRHETPCCCGPSCSTSTRQHGSPGMSPTLTWPWRAVTRRTPECGSSATIARLGTRNSPASKAESVRSPGATSWRACASRVLPSTPTGAWIVSTITSITPASSCDRGLSGARCTGSWATRRRPSDTTSGSSRRGSRPTPSCNRLSSERA